MTTALSISAPSRSSATGGRSTASLQLDQRDVVVHRPVVVVLVRWTDFDRDALALHQVGGAGEDDHEFGRDGLAVIGDAMGGGEHPGWGDQRAAAELGLVLGFRIVGEVVGAQQRDLERILAVIGGLAAEDAVGDVAGFFDDKRCGPWVRCRTDWAPPGRRRRWRRQQTAPQGSAAERAISRRIVSPGQDAIERARA